jgi:hypothetical protein
LSAAQTQIKLQLRRPIETDQCPTLCIHHTNATNLGIYLHVFRNESESQEFLRTAKISKEDILSITPSRTLSIPQPVHGEAFQANITTADTWNYLGLPKVLSDPAYDGGSAVTVGHLDTGIDEMHNGWDYPFAIGPADVKLNSLGYRPRIVERQDYYAGDFPFNPHGTLTGEIAYRSPLQNGLWNSPGYNVKIYDCRALGMDGQGQDYTVIDGFDWLAGKPVDIINASLGGTDDPIIKQAVEACWKAGILVCAASGNSGTPKVFCDGSVGSPADADDALAFGAMSLPIQDPTGNQAKVMTWESRGPRIDGSKIPYFFVAPGVNIQAGFCDPTESGTSFGSPHGAGSLVPLVDKAKRTLAPMMKIDRAIMIRQLLCSTALDLGYDKSGRYTQDQAWCIQGFGVPRLDVAYFLIGAPTPPQPTPPQPTPPSPTKYGSALWTGQYVIASAPTPPGPTPPSPTSIKPNLTGVITVNGNSVKVAMLLADPGTKAGIAGRSLIYTRDNQQTGGTGTTDASGAVTFNFVDPIPGSHTITVAFGGD